MRPSTRASTLIGCPDSFTRRIEGGLCADSDYIHDVTVRFELEPGSWSVTFECAGFVSGLITPNGPPRTFDVVVE